MAYVGIYEIPVLSTPFDPGKNNQTVKIDAGQVSNLTLTWFPSDEDTPRITNIYSTYNEVDPEIKTIHSACAIIIVGENLKLSADDNVQFVGTYNGSKVIGYISGDDIFENTDNKLVLNYDVYNPIFHFDNNSEVSLDVKGVHADAKYVH